MFRNYNNNNNYKLGSESRPVPDDLMGQDGTQRSSRSKIYFGPILRTRAAAFGMSCSSLISFLEIPVNTSLH